MQMTNEEIIKRYKNADVPQKKMVEILADLNGCKKNKIVEILYEAGELNGQQIYRYRKSGILKIEDEQEKPTEEISPVCEDVPVKKTPPFLIDLVRQWLLDNQSDYEEAFTYEEFCKHYREVEKWLKEEEK